MSTSRVVTIADFPFFYLCKEPTVDGLRMEVRQTVDQYDVVLFAYKDRVVVMKDRLHPENAGKTYARMTPDVVAQHSASYKGAYLNDSLAQEAIGFPQALETLRSWSAEQLNKERHEMFLASFDRVFGQNANHTLRLIEQVQNERALIESGNPYLYNAALEELI